MASSGESHVPELQRDNHLLQLPTETIDAILSHLSTDSIVMMSQTSRRIRAVALQNESIWYDHCIRLEKVYSSPEEFEKAVKRTAGAIQCLTLTSPSTDLVSRVTSITLDRDYLPINVNIIGRILDTFTGLRETRFVGCLASGMDFFTMASADGRSNGWISRGTLRLLDLSEDEKRLREIEFGPRRKRHKQDALVWGRLFNDDSEEEVTLFQDLFRGTSVEAYPLLCCKCNADASHSWMTPGHCLFCTDLGKCFQCQTIQTDEDVHFYVECEYPCKQRTQMCPECRNSVGWTYCSDPRCGMQLCPWCSSGTCGECGDYAALCTLHKCSTCKLLCRSCSSKICCGTCGVPSGCAMCTERITMGKCRICGKRTCMMCVRIRVYHGGDDETWSCVDCFNYSRPDAVRTGGRLAG